jgi:hypothetical protein
MPYKTESVPPELFMEHGGLKVYRTYRCGDIEQAVRTYGYSLDEFCGEDECGCADVPCKYVFDVRRLSNWTEPPHPPFLTGQGDSPANRKAWDVYRAEAVEENHIKAVISNAIDWGFLKASGS